MSIGVIVCVSYWRLYSLCELLAFIQSVEFAFIYTVCLSYRRLCSICELFAFLSLYELLAFIQYV